MSKQKFITAIALPVIIAMFLAGVGFGVREILFAQKQSSLVDFVPKEAEFWLLNRGAGLTGQVEAALRAVGVEEPVTDILKGQKQEIAIYRENGRWFKVTGSAVDGRQKGYAPYTLLNNPTPQIVGFLGVAHVKNVLGKFADIVDVSTPYYFALREKEGAVAFTFIKESAIKQVKVKEYAYSLPGESIVFKSTDTAFVSALREQVGRNIAERVAFMHPVQVSTQLPDKTYIQERVVKPDLFLWKETSPHRYHLVLDEEAVATYHVRDQLISFTSQASYYYDEGLFIIGKEESQEVALLGQGILAHPFFLYAPFVYEGEITTGDILGKSEAFSWLQNLRVKSIMVVEAQEGVYGEMRF